MSSKQNKKARFVRKWLINKAIGIIENSEGGVPVTSESLLFNGVFAIPFQEIVTSFKDQNKDNVPVVLACNQLLKEITI